MDEFVEVIKDGQIMKVSHRVAMEEDLFVLRSIKGEKEESNLPVRLFDKKSYDKKDYLTLTDWRKPKEFFEMNNVVKELQDNFHWIVARARRSKGFSRRRLAEEVGVSEEEIKIVEHGGLPSDDFVLVHKIEKILDVRLKKEAEKGVSLSDLQKKKDSGHEKVSGKEEEFVGDIEIVED